MNDVEGIADVMRVFQAMPHEFQFARNQMLGVELINEVHGILAERKERAKEHSQFDQSIYLIVFAMENFFSIRGVDRFDKPEPRKRLEEIVKDGPSLGIHSIVAAQTLAKGEILDTREFGLRVCFQTSEDDSRALLDTDAGTKMRPDRAIFRRYDWSYGRVEKFKPYLSLEAESIRSIAEILQRRARGGAHPG